MKKIKLMTDSVADIREIEAKELDIEIIPLNILFAGEQYSDVDLTSKELFDLMDEHEGFPTTSQVNPQVFVDTFKKYLDQDYQIVLITMSSRLSGTYNSANIAKEILDSDDIFIIDSLNVTCGQYLLLKYMVKLRDEGKTAKEITSTINIAKMKLKTHTYLNTLDYLMRSGRVDKISGFVGSMLGIKPIIVIEDGKLIPVRKVRGTKNAMKSVVEDLRKKKTYERSQNDCRFLR